MKIFVMVDMEGISGICSSKQVMSDQPLYGKGLEYLAADVNACVDGCFLGGAGKVVVRDAHSSGLNFDWSVMDGRAEYVQGGSDRERIPGIGTFDGLILLGYHAMAGTRFAILEHTMSSQGWQNFWINGRKTGEIGIDAGMAGDHGVPTIMVSGDDKACLEARRLIPGIVAVQVKKGLSCQGGLLLSQVEAHKRIRDGAAEAVGRCRSVKPLRFRKPVTMRLELVSRGTVPMRKAGVKVIDGRTYEVKGRSVEEALNNL